MKTIHICLKCLGYLIEALKFKSLMHAVTNRCYQSYSVQEAYTGEITQDWRSFKATFEAVTSPRRK